MIPLGPFSGRAGAQPLPERGISPRTGDQQVGQPVRGFDLWLALERGLFDPPSVVNCFSRYMEQGGTPVSRAEFEANLAGKADDPAFLSDIRPLLAWGVGYDPVAALEVVQQELVSRLPGNPWKGSATSGA